VVDKVTVLELQGSDDAATVFDRLAWLDPGRVVLLLPWDIAFLSRPLDYELLRREADRHQLEIGIVSLDPERRILAHQCGFPTFLDVTDAKASQVWRSRRRAVVEPPPQRWWSQTVSVRPRAMRPRSAWVRWVSLGARVAAFLLAIAVLAAAGYCVVPSASVTLIPEGQEFVTIVPVSLDPSAETADPAMQLVPARRVGVEVEGYIEVETTGVADVVTGRASGEVLFTNLLAQQYTVPAGTVVRTSSTSYPVRFRTTADVALPAGGQATVPIQGLQEGLGNVGAFQINQVEGVAASAVRVTNPTPTSGAEPQETHVVSQEDHDRARQQLTRQLLDQAFAEMLELLDPTEVLLRESLRIEAVPKVAYTRFVSEQADSVGLNLRLLVSGFALDVDDAEGVAYAQLTQQLPAGYTLVDASFELGEVAEEDVGIGAYTVFVTARGYAAQGIDPQDAVHLMRGKPLAEVREQLSADLPLATEPQIDVWPEWVGRMPLIPLRISVNVVPRAAVPLTASVE